jgi:hypothetical protein
MNKLDVGENKMHREIFGSKKDEVSKQFGILRDDELT